MSEQALATWKKQLVEASRIALMRRNDEIRKRTAKMLEIPDTQWEFTPDGHVIPCTDFCEHNQDAACWCKPTVSDEVTIHHSMDERETYEQGRQTQ